MRETLAFLVAVLFFLCSSRDSQADQSSPVGKKTQVTYHAVDVITPEVSSLRDRSAVPTVDVAIYLADSGQENHIYARQPSILMKSFRRAQKIFEKAGVRLRLRWVRRAVVPPAWLSVQANQILGQPQSKDLNPYLGYRRARWALTREAEKIFDGIIERECGNERTIYLLYLREVKMAYFDRTETGSAEIKVIPTGGLSLPAYLFENRIPRRIRGAITLCKNSGEHGRVIAHELGHKLMNVSHEYRDISPQFEVRGEGGLMLYGRGTEIPAGVQGRWHRERLHLSPFLYRWSADGYRVWNQDYCENGHYYDPLYRDKVVKFGVMDASREQ